QLSQQEGERYPHVVAFLHLEFLYLVIGGWVQVNVLAVGEEQLAGGIGIIAAHAAGLAQPERAAFGSLRPLGRAIRLVKKDLQALSAIVTALDALEQGIQRRISAVSAHRDQGQKKPIAAHKE